MCRLAMSGLGVKASPTTLIPQSIGRTGPEFMVARMLQRVRSEARGITENLKALRTVGGGQREDGWPEDRNDGGPEDRNDGGAEDGFGNGRGER